MPVIDTSRPLRNTALPHTDVMILIAPEDLGRPPILQPLWEYDHVRVEQSMGDQEIRTRMPAQLLV